MSISTIVTISLNVTKTNQVTKNGKPYAVVTAQHGGNFCIFPKVGDEKAAKIVAGLKVGSHVLENVGVGDGHILVYGDTKVS